ncbi:MAG TPA: formimidoylglutamate deiminase [Albidovulum sp.]|uniref:formimidoylglutamate deiminase n=1 Tax=Albidovulum sp. TaxID=1872424 RepID=UPI002B844529|nr:formimidoylglutamate deiminase [Albidovulum sp.]
MTEAIFAAEALLPGGWARDVRISLDGATITSVSVGAAPQAGDTRAEAVIPGMPNLHSHTFQRAMAGLTERRGPSADSFWTWRDLMYRFALSLTPEEVQAIAEMACVEMLETGFTRLGEFHYLHHGADGRPHANPAEMSLRIIAAAEATGIHLTLLPVFYAHSNFGGAAPSDGQRRFINDVDGYSELFAGAKAGISRPFDRIGIAPHSLRAATDGEITRLLEVHPDGPVHIHIAEQMREVEDCVSWSGQRPVERLLSQFNVDGRWCLIHATHLTEAERRGIVASGAVAGLCPVTEANLGDGLFPAQEFLAEGGRFGIGSDSNVEIAVTEELKILEYGQRLVHRLRNVLTAGEGSTGGTLLRAALQGGAQALGAPAAELSVGAPADMVALTDRSGLTSAGDRVLDRWVFGADVAVADVWAGGAHVVTGGSHRERERIAAGFARTMKRLAEG